MHFFPLIKPEITLISAAANNSYDHPHKAALENILKYGNAYGTWKDGNIVIKTNGEIIHARPYISFLCRMQMIMIILLMLLLFRQIMLEI